MRKTLNYFLIITCSYLLISCLAQSQIDDFYYYHNGKNKYQFSAYIDNTGGHEVLEYGVVWSSTQSKPTISDNKIVAGTSNLTKDGSFSCTHIFDSGIEFYCRAFVRDKKGTRYTETIHNIKTGYVAIVDSISPSVGFLGTEIKIYGKDFNPVNSDNSIKLNSTYYSFDLDIINSNDSILTAKVPNDTTNLISRGSSSYSISTRDSSFTDVTFFLNSMYKFPLREGRPGDNITIYCYGPSVNYNIYLGENLLTSNDWPSYPREYYIKVPDIAPGVYKLKMVNQQGIELICGNELGNSFKVNP